MFDLPCQFAYCGMAVLHVAEVLFIPPARYPDLFSVLNVLICSPVFVCVWLWSIKRGVEVAWALTPSLSGPLTSEGSKTRAEEKKDDVAAYN